MDPRNEKMVDTPRMKLIALRLRVRLILALPLLTYYCNRIFQLLSSLQLSYAYFSTFIFSLLFFCTDVFALQNCDDLPYGYYATFIQKLFRRQWGLYLAGVPNVTRKVSQL